MLTLYSTSIETPLGSMRAIGTDKALYLLDFENQKNLTGKIEHLAAMTGAEIVEGSCASLRSIERELPLYFSGKLTAFTTPLYLNGTPFQKRVWQELLRIPYGKTCSYSELACALGKPTAFRAAANANGRNLLAVIIPCHRVIAADGTLGGYSSGLHRKKQLLELEA